MRQLKFILLAVLMPMFLLAQNQNCDSITTFPFTENFDSYGSGYSSFMPCWHRYTNYSMNNSPQCNSNYKLSEPASLFFYSDANSFSIAMLPKLASDVDIQNLILTFYTQWTYGGTSADIGVMTSYNDFSSFESVYSIPKNFNSWSQQHKVTFQNYEGDGKIIAIKFVGGSTGSNMTLDDLVLDVAPSCSPVVNLSVSNISGNSAMLSWQNGDFGTPSLYNIEYSVKDEDDWQYASSTDTFFIISGLAQETQYSVRIFTQCTDFSVSDTVYLDFETSCNNMVEVEIAGGNEQSFIFPLNTNYKNSYTQQIYTSSELENIDVIKSIFFEYAYHNPLTTKSNVSIYLGHTNKDHFNNINDYVEFSNLTKVYAGNLNCVEGWNKFDLDTPFEYNGIDNLVVAVLDSSNTYIATTYKFKMTNTNQIMALDWHTDNKFIDPTDPNAGSIMTSMPTKRSNIKFRSPCLEDNQCVMPNVL